MKARRRLAIAALLLLIFVGGTIAVVALAPADGERDAVVDDAARVETKSRGERHRVRVADAPEPPPATVATTTTATVTRGVRRPAEPDAPPTTGPIRIRREEPSGDGEQGALRIRVDDGAGAARDDVRVSVMAATDGTRGTRYAGTIPSTGITIDDVDAGWATVTLSAGSLTRTTRVKIDAGLVSDVDLSLPLGAIVTGEVRHRDHGLLPGLIVDFGRILQSRNVEGAFRDTIVDMTDERGVYRLTGIPPGPCILTFGGGALGRGLKPRTTFDVPVALEVRHDVLLGSVSLEGVVRGGADLVPVANARVSVQRPHFTWTTTDAQGRYAFVDLVPGRQRVCISAEGFGLVFTETEPVLAGRATRCDVELAQAVSLTLIVKDDEGSPVTTEMIVTFHPKKGTPGTGLSTNFWPDGDGRIEYDKVVPGSYGIGVRDRLGGFSPSDVEVVLAPGPNDVEIVMPRSSSPEVHVLVEGIVRCAETGRPVAGAEIQSVGRVITGVDGRFELRGLGGRPSFVDVRGDGFGQERVDVPAEGPLEISLRRAAELVLHLRGKHGSPFVGRIGLYVSPREEHGTRLGASVEADDHGMAALRRVVPGRYTLNIGDGVDGRAEFEIDIQPGRNELDVDLR